MDSGCNEMDEELKSYLEAIEERLIQKVRDMRSELLGDFESFATGQNLRLRKLEEAQSTSEYLAQKRRCP